VNWRSEYLGSVDGVFGVLDWLRGKRWLSRGQCYPWANLRPSFERHQPLSGLSRAEKIRIERQSIDLFRSTVRSFASRAERRVLSDDIRALTVLRHYGVRTRFLDWSLSPHVAAYFAVEDRPSDDGELFSFDHNLYVIEGSKQWARFPETTTDGSGDPTKFDLSMPTAFRVAEPSPWFVCVFYPPGFPRQDAQHSAYSLTARFNVDHVSAISDLLQDREHFLHFRIPASIKAEVKAVLRERHGIWRGSLFPDSAGAAETVSRSIPELGGQ